MLHMKDSVLSVRLGVTFDPKNEVPLPAHDVARSGRNNMAVDFSSCAHGTYLLRIESDTQVWNTVLVFVQ